MMASSGIFPSSQRRGGAKRRGGQFGASVEVCRSDHPVCAASRWLPAHPPLLCEEGKEIYEI